MSTGAYQASVNGKKVYCVPYFPVGFIIEMNKNTNPTVYFGGTWELYGVGRVTACINTADTDTNTKTSFNQKVGTNIGSKYLQYHTHHANNFIINEVGASLKEISVGSGNLTVSAVNNNRRDVEWYGSGDAENIQPTVLVYRWVKTSD